MAGRPYRSISISLDPADIARLEARARSVEEPSVSAVVRIAITEYLCRTEMQHKN
jgi:hypothetical protein